MHENFIAGTKPKQYVKVSTLLLCQLSSEVRKAIGAKSSKVYISSKSIKHIYDRHCHEKKQNNIYTIIIDNLDNIVKYPDMIKQNKESKKKKGAVVFIKEINGITFACPIEISMLRKVKKMKEIISVVSVFKKNEGYLKDTKILYTK